MHPQSGVETWYDGTQWTDQRRVNGAPAPAPATTQVAAVEELPAGVLWQSTGRPLSGMGAGRYRLTETLLYVETGSLSTKAKQIGTHEIHDVDASQTMTQKMRGVGDIILMAARPGGAERVALVDVPDFREGVRIINEVSHATRDAHRVKAATTTVN